jgi:hypothetical protein
MYLRNAGGTVRSVSAMSQACVCLCVRVPVCFVEEIRALSSVRSACCVDCVGLAGGTRSAVDASFNWIKLVERRT